MRRMKKGLEDGWKNEDDEENEIKRQIQIP